MIRIIPFLLSSIVLFSSCSPSKDSPDRTVDAFTAVVVDGLKEMEITNVFELPLEQHEIYYPMHTVQDNSGRYILVNGVEWEIILLSSDGELVHRTGGNGRGPGEFTAINHVEITDDNQLYVLDLTQNRVTHFSISDNEIEFVKIISIPISTDSGHYRSIHHINGKFWGVLATSEFNRRFYLLELDSLLQPIREHIEIPAHFPNIHFSQSQITNGDWFSGDTTFNYFFYDSLVVYSYDVTTERKSRHILREPHQNRQVRGMNQDFIEEKFGGNPTSLPTDRNTNTTNDYDLIQTRNMSRYVDMIVTAILYYGGEHTTLILYDVSTGEKRFIKAPSDFHISYFSNNTLIGEQVIPGGPNLVIVLQLEE